MNQYWNQFCDQLLSEVRGDEALGLNLLAEESLFLRFNHSKIRQSTKIKHAIVELKFQKDQREVSLSTSLSGHLESDLSFAKSLLERARLETMVLPVDTFLVPLANHGVSREEFLPALPTASEVIETVTQAHGEIDQAGFYCGGPLIRANRNSLGQNHWFRSDCYFYDYSIFTENASSNPKAVKGCFSQSNWDPAALMKQVAQKKSLIPIMKQKEKELSPGSFRAYLEPSAVLEIVGLLNWRAFDFSAYKQGSAAFAKLADGKESLSAKFSIGENFELGLSPRFNSLGELAPQKLEVVTQGHLKNWLVSSRAAKEYGVNSNAGEGVFRSAEIACGNLPMASALKELGTGVALGNLHYLNWSDMPAARITGMTRYACFWVEKGEIVAPIKDMRFDESLYQILGRDLIDLTVENETSPNMLTYERREPGGFRTPGLLLSSLVFKM